MFRIACPRQTWRITAISSASFQPSAKALAEAEAHAQLRLRKARRQESGSSGQGSSGSGDKSGGTDKSSSAGGSSVRRFLLACSNNSAVVHAAVAAACVGQSSCFLQPGERALGPDPCAGAVPGEREMAATVTCTPPPLLRSSGLRPLAQEQQQALKW